MNIRSTCLVLILLLGLSRLSMAQSAGYQWRLVASWRDSVQVEIVCATPQQIRLHQLRYGTEIEIPDAHYSRTPGAPHLPYYVWPLSVVDQRGSAVRIAELQDSTISGVDLPPNPPRRVRSPLPGSSLIKGEPYSQLSYYPSQVFTLGKAYVQGETVGQSLRFSPVQYDAQRKELRIILRAVITLTNLREGSEPEMIGLRPRRGKRNTPTASPAIKNSGPMLVVTPSKYLPELERFCLWKRMRGIHCEIITYGSPSTSGYDNVQDTVGLIAKIKQRYQTSSSLAFLLLIGNERDVPSLVRSAPKENGIGFEPAKSDQAYGQILGPDAYNEISVGRFFCEDAQGLQTQIDRTIAYERDTPASATWLNHALGIAGNESITQHPRKDREFMEDIRTILLDYGYTSVAAIYDRTGQPATVESVFASWNPGLGLLNYAGHGTYSTLTTSGFRIQDANELTNRNKLPVTILSACNVAEIHRPSSLGTALVQATDQGEPTGSVALLGCSAFQDWISPLIAQEAINKLWVNKNKENYSALGAIITKGFQPMIIQEDEYGPITANTWNLLGDPSLLVRTHQPASMKVVVPQKIVKTSTKMEIQCDVEGATAVLAITRKDGSHSYFDQTVTGGKATFSPLALALEDKGQVVVTAKDRVTYLSPEIYVDSSPYTLQIDKFGFTAMFPSTSTSPWAGESWKITPTVTYLGSATPGDHIILQAQLADPKSAVQLRASKIDVPSLSPKEQVKLNEGFEIYLDPNIPDSTRVEVIVAAIREEEVLDKRSYSFRVGNYRAVITEARPVIPAGGSGLLIPGRNITLQCTISNRSRMLTNAELSLEWITGSSQQHTASLANINAQTSQEIELVSTIPSTLQTGDIAQLRLSLRKSGQELSTLDVAMVVGTMASQYTPSTALAPFASTTQRRSFAMRLSPQILGSTPKRVVAFSLPIAIQGEQTMRFQDLQVHVAPIEQKELTPIALANTFDTSAHPTNLQILDGKIRIPVSPFLYDGQSDHLLTIQSSLVKEQPYAAQTGCEWNPIDAIWPTGTKDDAQLLYRYPLFTAVEAVESNFTIKCVDSQNTPISKVTVAIDGKSEQTNAQGVVSFMLLEGSYQVTLESDLYEMIDTTLTLRQEQPEYSFVMEELPARSILVSVVNGQSGRSIANAEVRVNTQLSQTDKGGKTHLLLKPGAHTITVYAKGYHTKTQRETVSQNTQELLFRLTPDYSPTELTEQIHLRVWPIPAEEHLHVTCDEEILHYRILNVAGQSVMTRSLSMMEATLDLGSLPAGTYILELTTRTGQLARQRFVKL